MNYLRLLSNVFKKNKIINDEHQAILSALNNQVGVASEDVALMKLELVLNSATGEWVDEWGSWFGIRRLAGEEDESYRNRILAMVSNPKSTIPAIEESIKSFLGDLDSDVTVYEPFNDVLRFGGTTVNSGGTFSETFRFQDASYYRAGVIDVFLESDVSKELRDTVNQIKAAGVKVYFTRKIQLPLQYIVAPSEVTVKYETWISNELLIFPDSSSARYSDSLPNQPMSGGKTTFYEVTVVNNLDAEVVSNTVYSYRASRTTTLFTSSVVGAPLTNLHVSIVLPKLTVVSNLNYNKFERTTQFNARVTRGILAGSEVTLDSILDMTIEEVVDYRDENQGSVHVITSAV